MIKATGVVDDKPLLLLGLSGENITRLVAGEPIRFNLSEVGMPPIEVVIMYGRTEDEIVTELNSRGNHAP